MVLNYTIILQSFYYNILKIFLKNFNSLLKVNKIFNYNVLKIKIISLPKKKKLYTVLKSPHVHKQAREQFGLNIHKCGVDPS